MQRFIWDLCQLKILFLFFQISDRRIFFINFNMYKQVAILLVCLVAFSAAQTCSTSTLDYIESGTLTLGVPTNTFAQKDYNVTLAGKLGLSAKIHTAFAIAGFQGSCTQTYFALGVDTVYFQNSNTKMKFSMNYVYNDNTTTYTSQWTRVKLNYLLVSDLFESYKVANYGGNYIWADSVQFTVTKGGVYGVWGAGSIFQNNTDFSSDSCGYMNLAPSSSSAKFDSSCPSADRIIPHYYIMGFQFAPGSQTLGAMTKINSYLTTDYIQNAIFGTSEAQGWGPLVEFNQFGGSLKKLKVAVVLTTLRDAAQTRYPNTIQSFGYSGVYMPIEIKNIYRPIVQGNKIGDYNKERFDLAKLTYGIYGLASFSISPSASCVAIDVDVEIKDLYNVIVRTDNTDALNDVFVAADFFSRTSLNLCSASSSPSRTMNQITSRTYLTVPDLAIDTQDIALTNNDPAEFTLTGSSVTGGSSTITYNITSNYEGFISGNAYKVTIDLAQQSLGDWAASFTNNPIPYIKWVTQIDGKTANDVNLTSVVTPSTLKDSNKVFGIAIKSTNPVVRFLVTIPRPIQPNAAGSPIGFKALLRIKIEQFTVVYNPTTDCCTSQCPDGSGINHISNPPSCIVCKGDSNLAFDTNTGICSCKTGYYNVLEAASTGSLVCFPCLAKLCGTCVAANVTRCTTCVVGAALGSDNVCSCVSGYYESNGECKVCPAKCNGCQVNGVCSACADPLRRKLDQNCDCPAGFFDDGSSTCKTCNSLCKTCTNSTSCTSCFSENNRTLVNGQCVCASGFYQVVNSDNTVTCRRCSSECKECSGPTLCLNCDAASNRLIAYDDFGRQTCSCAPGYNALKDGSCVQNGCTADPFCQDCDEARGVKVCIQCVSSTNRVLAIPQYACVCKEGFYDDKGVCRPCSSGCAKCSNATVCERCAVSATNNTNGTCSCPQSYFFAVEPLRFCKRCKPYCLKCNDENSCETCLPGFTPGSNGECICARGKYVNSNLQCVPCINNCTVCSSETNCTLCTGGYFLQDQKCVTRCNLGYYISGVVCEKCQDGCAHCDRAGSCLICEAGRYAFNGLCYVNCPSGSIAEVTNMTCLACNSPCGTCTQHPSKCLTCLSGNFFEFGCVDSCPVGTYSENKTCKYCAFECAACLGSANTCIACPDGQYLFEAKCYAKCPIPLVNGKCPNLCPAGYFTQAANGNCVKCSDKCKSCDGAADKCTSCASGVASNGVCVPSCPANTLSVNGNCVPCAQGCNGCTGSIDKCSACQSGFFLAGTKCQASCESNYFRDGANGCRKCPDTCKSCTSATACTSCVESRNQPINGVCYTCIYPCTNCTSYEQCTGCLNGFNLINGRCTSQCPAGSSPVNGVCKCVNGVFQNGQCTARCSSGFTNIDGTCQQCSENCVQCSGKTTTCTTCKSGFLLNSVTGVCEVNRNCQFGEYFSTESSTCKRICPTGYSYQDSVCVSECLSGFRDNGFGGCVELGVVTGCSFPYFYQQGSCVSSCNAGSYPNSASRVCEACSSNCFSCMSSAFCTSCSSGFDLKNNICITGERCAGNKLKYNGVCLDSCPVGTVVSNGYCARRCDPNSFFLDNKCYADCPTGFNYRTDVACVAQCPIGYIVDGKVCKLVSQNCPSGQFYNAQTGVCATCTYPCTECQYSSNYCSACPSGFTLNSNKCAQANSCGTGKFRTQSGSCSNCPQKCLECVSATECATCATGYIYNGADCVLKLANLKEVTMTQTALSRRGTTVFVSVRLSIIPNGLSNEQKSSFFVVVPSVNDKVNRVNQWISTSDANTVIIAVEYATFPASTSTLFVGLNANILSSSLASVGFTATQNSFLSVVISNSITTAPSTLIIPSTTMSVKPDDAPKIGSYSVRMAARRSVSTIDQTL